MDLKERLVKAARLEGSFVLRSGKTSRVYFDKYQFESRPQLLRDICLELQKLIPEDVEVLAGLEMGGIPIVTILSQLLEIPCAFIRKEAKAYGTCNYAEGAAMVNKKVVLIEDVVSSGGAIIAAVEKMRADGIEPEKAFCIIDRETGGKENLESIGIELISLFKMSELTI